MYINRHIKQLGVAAVFGFLLLTNSLSIGADIYAAETNTEISTVLPVPRIERAVFVVEHDKGRGSGFLMQQTGVVFFVSNIHVLSGGSQFSIKNVYGESVSIPDTVQVAADRDLVRFPVPYKGGLRMSPEYGFDDKICAVGNSGGEGVLTRLDGKIMALGPKVIEISSNIIPGNSGGPVLDQSNQVVGVSTYLVNHKNMPDWIIKGSRFTEARRMAARVDNVEWITMSWKDFCRESAYVNQMEDYAGEIIGIVKALSDDSLKTIYSETPYRGIQDWIKEYNQYVRSYGSRMEKVETSYRVSYKTSPALKRSYREKIRGLAELMDSLSNEIDSKAVSIPYFKERLEQSVLYFESSRQHMETLVETVL